MKKRVFVYGTLMRGQANHKYYLSESEYIGEGEISGYSLYDVGCFPGIVVEPDEKVKGEVYFVDEETLIKLDLLEGEGSLYNRRIAEIRTVNIISYGYVYVWNRSIQGARKIDYKVQPWKG